MTSPIVALALLEHVVEVRTRITPDRQIGMRLALDVEIAAHRAPQAPRRFLTCSTTCERNAPVQVIERELATLAPIMAAMVAAGVIELQATARRR